MIFNTTFVPHAFSSTFKLSILSSTLAAIALLGGCASTPTQKATHVTYKNKASTANSSDLLDADSFDSLEDLLYATDMRAVESDRLSILRYGDVWKRMTVGFKMDLNRFDPRIEAQRSWFTSRQTYLDRLSARASRYLYYTVKEAERRGIPTELALLPIIESSYDPSANSSAAAAGLWQFIPSTGKIYGLRQSDLYDGRRDVVESTRAAYEYLTSLYNQFGSWELALASYNAGPGRVQQAINRNAAAGLPTDYWSLRLPTETMNYVPRFLAVAQIIKNPQRYNVYMQPIANRPHFREVDIPGAIDLNELSRITGVSRGELYALNPAHRGNYTDPYAPRRILIPNDVSLTLDSKINRMPTVSGSGGLWAGSVAPPPTFTAKVLTPSTATVPALTSTVTSSIGSNTASYPNNSATVSTSANGNRQVVIKSNAIPVPETDYSATVALNAAATSPTVFTKQPTPVGSAALAQFANSAVVPSAPRLPVSITPNTNVKPIAVEPPLTAAEKQAIIADNTDLTTTAAAQLPPKVATQLVKTITEPAPTDAEKQQVVKELQQISPQGTQIVDPLDGKIKLTAIQSSQSIATQKGEDVKITYAYPKALAEAEIKNPTELSVRNKGKSIVETNNEVVVIPPESAPKGKRDSYVVREGDTLLSIAAKNGVNWRDIVKWNQVDPEKSLHVGTKLYLYNAKPVAAPKSEKYIVQNGDSLTSVAAENDISLQDLAAWNNLSVTSNLLRGQRLTLVEPKNFKASIQKQVTETRPAVSNSISPNDSIATHSYTVKRGEYLKMLAERYDMTNVQFAALTPNLSPTANLLVGQRINVPKAVPKAVPIATEKKIEDKIDSTVPMQTTSSKYLKTKTYVVVAGDNLTQIAQRHGMSLTEIASLNNLTSISGVYSGQRLKVYAVDGVKPTTYKVQNGDSLTSIAAKFGLKPQYLASINGLAIDAKVNRGVQLNLVETTNNPKAQDIAETEKVLSQNAEKLKKDSPKSQKIKPIDDKDENPKDTAKDKGASSSAHDEKPKSKPATENYSVKAGETLTALAARSGMSVAEFAELNNLKPNTSLRSGQKLQMVKRHSSYTVKSGDSLIRLAKKYGMTPQEFADLNNLKPTDDLQLGKTIKVPSEL